MPKAKQILNIFTTSFLAIALLLTVNSCTNSAKSPLINNNEPIIPSEEPSTDSPDKQLVVHYINVGDGDAILLIQGNHAMMIDGGPSNKANEVFSYLKKQHIESLDYIVATHPFSNHIGGLSAILKRMPVKQVIMPDVGFPTDENMQFLTDLEESGAVATYPNQGNKFQLGDATLTVLSPSIRDEYSNKANYSLVIRVEYGKTSYLFTGSAMREVEMKLLESDFDLNSDVLKVARYGSAASSTSGFLDAVNPSIAVISATNDNDYMSDGVVIERLKSRGINTFRTAVNGNIVVTSDGTKISVSVENSVVLLRKTVATKRT